MSERERNKSNSAPVPASACVIAALLIKLSKHLALIACLMIVGGSTGRFAASQFGILLTVVTAALLHAAGCFLRRRLPPPARVPRFDR